LQPRDPNTSRPISRTRALTAKLASTPTTTFKTENSHKRLRIDTSSQDNTPTEVHKTPRSKELESDEDKLQDLSLELVKIGGVQSKNTITSKEQVSKRPSDLVRTLRSSTRAKSSSNIIEIESDEGNTFNIKPVITMIGGIPQNSDTDNTLPLNRVSKLRNHAISMLPSRSFSFF
jgi:hypothetical protein